MKKNLKDLHKSCNNLIATSLYLITLGSVLLAMSIIGIITNFNFTDVIFAVIGIYAVASGTKGIIDTNKRQQEFEDYMYKSLHEYIEKDVKQIKDKIENLVEEENTTPKVVE